MISKFEDSDSSVEPRERDHGHDEPFLFMCIKTIRRIGSWGISGENTFVDRLLIVKGVCHVEEASQVREDARKWEDSQ